MIPGSTAAEFSDKSYAQDAGLQALKNHLRRIKIAAHVTNGQNPGTYRVLYNITRKPLVSIIIPFKDKPELLEMCLNSIYTKTSYENYEIICVNNNSEQEITYNFINDISKKYKNTKFIDYNIKFNYSKINNYAVNNYANGEHIILLNNDIEIITPDWIQSLLSFSQFPETGVVGAKLYYPNDTIQHAGIIIGIGGVAGHSHKYFEKDEHGYLVGLKSIKIFQL